MGIDKHPSATVSIDSYPEANPFSKSVLFSTYTANLSFNLKPYVFPVIILAINVKSQITSSKTLSFRFVLIIYLCGNPAIYDSGNLESTLVKTLLDTIGRHDPINRDGYSICSFSA